MWLWRIAPTLLGGGVPFSLGEKKEEAEKGHQRREKILPPPPPPPPPFSSSPPSLSPFGGSAAILYSLLSSSDPGAGRFRQKIRRIWTEGASVKATFVSNVGKSLFRPLPPLGGERGQAGERRRQRICLSPLKSPPPPPISSSASECVACALSAMYQTSYPLKKKNN